MPYATCFGSKHTGLERQKAPTSLFVFIITCFFSFRFVKGAPLRLPLRLPAFWLLVTPGADRGTETGVQGFHVDRHGIGN